MTFQYSDFCTRQLVRKSRRRLHPQRISQRAIIVQQIRRSSHVLNLPTHQINSKKICPFELNLLSSWNRTIHLSAHHSSSPNPPLHSTTQQRSNNIPSISNIRRRNSMFLPSQRNMLAIVKYAQNLICDISDSPTSIRRCIDRII